MKYNTKLIAFTAITLMVIAWTISFLVVRISKPNAYNPQPMDHFAWAELDRIKGHGEPSEATAYYYRGLRCEDQGDYDNAIKNYDIYSQKIGRKRPEVYARALYYSGKKRESAREYLDATLQIKTRFDAGSSKHYSNRASDYPQVIEWLNYYVICYPYGIPGPFTTLEELKSFLMDEENAFLRDDEHFKEVVDFLKFLAPHAATVQPCPCPRDDRRAEIEGRDVETGEKINDKIDENRTEKGENPK